MKSNDQTNEKILYFKKVVKPSFQEEIQNHKKYLKTTS